MKTAYLKKNILAAVLILVFAMAMAACASPADSSAPAAEPVSDTAEQQTFTLEELAKYDGQNGNPAYVAIDGIVYDVTNIPQWMGGKHNGYSAGKDLTEEMQAAPHGFSKLSGLTEVGILAE